MLSIDQVVKAPERGDRHWQERSGSSTREMVVYLQLCSSIQQGQIYVNALWKEREEVSLLLRSDTGWMVNAGTHNGEVIHLQQDQSHN